jgi:hypothetical protein
MQDNNSTVATTENTAKLTPAQIEAVADQNGKAYQREIIKSTFKARTQGFWAGSGLGMLYGVMTGIVVAASTLVVGVPLLGAVSVVSMLPAVAGAFALAGMAVGAAVMTMVNSSAGAALGAAKVNDRKRLLENPSEEMARSAEYRGVAQEMPQKEGLLHHILPFNKGSSKVFSVKNALIFGGLALAAAAIFFSLGGGAMLAGLSGGLLAHAPAVAAVAAAHPAAATCMAVATAGSFGASFGFDGPTLAANSTQFVGDLFSSKSSRHKAAPAPTIVSASQTQITASHKVTVEEAAQLSERLNTIGEKSFSQNITSQQMQPASMTTGV